MKSLITPAIVLAAFNAEFATIGIRAATMIVATIRTAANLADVNVSDIPKKEARALAIDITARLTAKGCAPCDKEGTPYNKRDMAGFISDCVRTAYGQKKVSALPPVLLAPIDPDTPFNGPVSGTVPRDKVDNTPVNAAPLGDGVAANAAVMGLSAETAKRAYIKTVGLKLQGMKHPDAKTVHEFVNDVLALLA